MKENYQTLKNCIRLVDERNKDLQTTNLLGINIDKFFMPSVANIIGTDLTDYKLIKRNQFACNPMHVGRDDRMPIALYQNNEAAIVSPAYFVFEITDIEKLLPKYAMLWFMRPEFDRECWFYTDSSVRGGITWDAITDMKLPVPSLDKQMAIIKAYEVIQNRIDLKRKINDNLEAQMFTLFDDLVAEQLSWADGTIKDFGEIISGATPSTAISDNFTKSGIAWITPRDTTSQNRKFTSHGNADITKLGYKSCSTRLMPAGSVLFTSRAPVGFVTIAINELCTNQGFKSIIPFSHIGTAFVYCFLKRNAQLIESYGSGTTFLEVSTSTLQSIPVKLPPISVALKLTHYCKPIFDAQIAIENEIGSLQETKTLLLSKLVS